MRSTRSRSPARKGDTSGTTTASATSTSPRSSSTSTSGTSTRRSSRRSRSRPTSCARSARRWRRSRGRGSASCSRRSRLAISACRSSRTRARRRTRTRSSSRGSRPAGTRSSRAIARTTARRTARSCSPATRAAGRTSRGWVASSGCSIRTRTAAPPVIPDPCPVCTGAPHLEEILEYEGAHTVAAVILETVTGTNGIIPPPPGYLQAIREVCDRHGILLILDEVMAGFGRTGRWFACENWDVVPDIITVAKGINSGYVPLGAMIIREHLKEWVRGRFFPGGLTYAGHPLACAPRSRRSRRSRRRASSRTRPTSAPTSVTACAGSRCATRRSARCAASAASGESSS